jgi:hypothetical protein
MYSQKNDTISYYSISPAISNGLSLNTKTGTISGTPTVASDALTYTVTAVLMLYDIMICLIFF